MYGKFFASTFTGSMFGAGPDVFAVWGYVIANTVQSTVELNPSFLAAVLGASQDRIAAAIDLLCQPDPRSRSHEAEGRRLVHEGAFQYRVVNHDRYRALKNEDERRKYNREAKRRERAVKRDVIDMSAVSAQAEAEAEADTEAKAEAESVKTHTRATAAGPLAGSLPRDHIDHGFCGSRFCVTSKILLDMTRRYGDGGAAAVQAWLQSLNDGLGAHESPGGPVWVLRQFDAFLEAQGRLRKPIAPLDDWKARARAAGGAKK